MTRDQAIDTLQRNIASVDTLCASTDSTRQALDVLKATDPLKGFRPMGCEEAERIREGSGQSAMSKPAGKERPEETGASPVRPLSGTSATPSAEENTSGGALPPQPTQTPGVAPLGDKVDSGEAESVQAAESSRVKFPRVPLSRLPPSIDTSTPPRPQDIGESEYAEELWDAVTNDFPEAE